ncbi:MAG: carbonic anhydrase [Acidobacteria bacterium]|nr:MAG: carbonic anhydrase [Acidobacteriota bacterium]
MECGQAIRQSVPRTRLRTLSVVPLGIALAIPVLAQSPGSQIWNELASGNRRFMDGKSEARDLVARRKDLAKTQSPRVAVLSCADSRVPPELVFDEGLGDLFVVRSAGESADPLAVGSLEYAVEHLGTVVIVVMGHQSCGAVKAACSGEKAASRNLEAVVAPIAASCTKVDKRKPDTFDLAGRDHVHSVARELLVRSAILKKASDEGELTIVEAYYSLETGEVTKLR